MVIQDHSNLVTSKDSNSNSEGKPVAVIKAPRGKDATLCSSTVLGNLDWERYYSGYSPKFTQNNLLRQAIALNKIILLLDPGYERANQQISELYRQLTLTDKKVEEQPAPVQPRFEMIQFRYSER